MLMKMCGLVRTTTEKVEKQIAYIPETFAIMGKRLKVQPSYDETLPWSSNWVVQCIFSDYDYTTCDFHEVRSAFLAQ